jgi:hypothetical protein
MAATVQETINLLLESYSMELETVMNYLANSVNLDGVRSSSLAARSPVRRRWCSTSRSSRSLTPPTWSA